MSLEDRVKSLEEWRDALTQACFQAPKTPVGTTTETPLTATEIAGQFPEDLRQHLTVNAKEGWIKSEFVSSEKFAAISKRAEELGYKRIVDGKNTRWIKQ